MCLNSESLLFSKEDRPNKLGNKTSKEDRPLQIKLIKSLGYDYFVFVCRSLFICKLTLFKRFCK